MGCGHTFLKYTLFAFNFLFWVLGLVVLGVGIYSRINSKNYDSLLGDGGVASAANILIAAGVFVAIIGFVGCCGAIRQNKVMLIIYFILVLLIFILEIVAGALAYTKKDLMEKHLKDNLTKVVSTNYLEGKTMENPSQLAMNKALDWLQQTIECCGTNGYADWKKAGNKWAAEMKNLNRTDELAPKSCCKVENAAGCNKNQLTIYTKGCFEAGKSFVKEHMWQVGGVGIGIAVIQVFVMVAAILLCRNIDKEGNLA